MRVIYKMTLLTNGKIYVGQHTDDTDNLQYFYKNYWGSGTLWMNVLKSLRKKYGNKWRDYISKEILFQSLSCSDKCLNEMERYWIMKLNSLFNFGKGNGYNLLQGATKSCCRVSEETKKKLSKKMTGKKRFDGFPEWISAVNKGKIRTPEMRKRYSDAQKKRFANGPAGFEGKHFTDEQKRKISIANKGKVRTPEMRKRLSEARKSLHLHHTEEEKINQSNKLKEYYKTHVHPMKGKKLSPEHIQNIKNNLPDFSGERNGMYGKRFITDGKVNRLIKSDDELPLGWRYGMACKNKRKK